MQRVAMARDVALLSVREPGATWLVLVSSRVGAVGVGVLGWDERGRAKGLVHDAVPRPRLAPAAVIGLSGEGVWLSRGGEPVALATSLPLREHPSEAAPDDLAPASDLAAWLAQGASLLARLEGSSLQAARSALLGAVDREAARLRRRVLAVHGDLSRGREAEAAAEHARLFVAPAARAPRGTARLSAEDWSSGEPIAKELVLDTARRPIDQIEAIFARARRLKTGAVVAQARIADARLKLARLSALRAEAMAATGVPELEAARRAALEEDPALLPGVLAVAAGRGSGRAAPPRVPYRAFVSASGPRILVGRGARDNDELTLHVARPHDLWLHAKGRAGAHVVVPLQKGRDAPPDLLVDAAHLAAHFSDARDEAVVDVSYAARRHVRKPRGSAPGLVHVDREKVLALRVDPARLRLLLAREEVPA